MEKSERLNMIWDVIVIGGGPAGMMAAGTAASTGKKVLLLEKNDTLGKKLLITGGGRCNVTNNKQNNRVLLPKYKGSDKFLFSPFSQFAVKDSLSFFNTRGMDTKEENDGRMFPVSDTAQSVWDVLVSYMKEHHVTVQQNTVVTGIKKEKDTFSIHTDKGVITTTSCIVATGGTSRPETGSTGEGFTWLHSLGHSVVDKGSALVPVAIKDEWIKKLSGVTLEHIKVSVFQNGKRQESHIGKILFTHVGLSGPMILNMSKGIGESLQYGEVTLVLDLFPDMDEPDVKDLLQSALIEESNKKIKNTLGSIIPSALVADVLLIANIDGNTPNHSVRTEDRKKLVKQLKAITLTVKSLLGKDKAVIASGGIPLEEVDTKTMQSRIVPNLYLVGDTLHIDRPSGGYSLQLCWTTGFVAGKNA